MNDSNAANLNVGQSLQSILFVDFGGGYVAVTDYSPWSIEDLCRATREINRVFRIMSREEHHEQKRTYRCFL